MVHKKNNSHSIVMHPHKPHIKQPCTDHVISYLLNIQTQSQGQQATRHPSCNIPSSKHTDSSGTPCNIFRIMQYGRTEIPGELRNNSQLS